MQTETSHLIQVKVFIQVLRDYTEDVLKKSESYNNVLDKLAFKKLKMCIFFKQRLSFSCIKKKSKQSLKKYYYSQISKKKNLEETEINNFNFSKV